MKARRLLTPALALGLIAMGIASGAPPAAKKSVKSNWPAIEHSPSEVAALIDRVIEAKLAEANVPASPVCDDAEFLRRLSLDVRGRVPTALQTSEFLADSDPDKRRKLIDDCLDDAEYGEHFAIIWYHRMIKPDMDNAGLLSKDFQAWLGERFNANEGWDKTVKSILTASGEREENPATVFWLANVEGNQQREVAPNKVAAAASHLFLGIRLECCECHNHPFDEGLKQTDFWSTAAFFTTTRALNANKADAKSKREPEIQEGGPAAPRRVAGKAKGKAAPRPTTPLGSIAIPDSKGKTATARFLLGEMPKLGNSASLRQTFADWLTSPKNPYFAKASVNKLWANFFGRGIANPVDDMRPGTPNAHPELLDALAIEFAASGFDQKHAIRCICLSNAYQRTSAPLTNNKADEELFSHMRLKPMSADMLYDSLQVVLDHSIAERGRPGRGGAVGGALKARGDTRDQVRKVFHAEAADDAGIVEEYSHGIPQVLKLMNAQQMNNTGAVVKQLMKDAKPEQVIEGLYVRVLSRKPTDAETNRMKKYVAGESDKAKAYGDALWVLLNSAEFMFNH